MDFYEELWTSIDVAREVKDFIQMKNEKGTASALCGSCAFLRYFAFFAAFPFPFGEDCSAAFRACLRASNLALSSSD